MESKIVSLENIKPASSTPLHLKTHNLSLLDQILPPNYAPVVFYFPAPPDLSNKTEFVTKSAQILKQSLAVTLTKFHPLAGRANVSALNVDCNDQGVLYIVSRIKGDLSDFLKKPNHGEVRRHVPHERLIWAEPTGSKAHVVMIKVSMFDCGGMAIGSLFLHAVTDGVTICSFIKAWATNSALLYHHGLISNDKLPDQDYTTGSHCFPNNKDMKRESHFFSIMSEYFKTGNTTTRRYVFESQAISKLRAATNVEHGRHFSRVEVVSALLWKCFNLALLSFANNTNRTTTSMTSLVTHVLNMRRKASPPFPDHCFGNFVWFAPASCEVERDMDLNNLAHNLRRGMAKIDNNFVSNMQGEQGFLGYCQNVEKCWNDFPMNAEYLNIASWCNFGLYDIDFGWGPPAWISRCDAGSNAQPVSFINTVWLMDTRDGDGIEAWVTLDSRYSEHFHNVEELQDLAYTNPCPLDIGSRFQDCN